MQYPDVFDFSEEFSDIVANPNSGLSVPVGWAALVGTLLLQMRHHAERACPDLRIAQVKEKFGALRVYYVGGDADIRGMVRMAEALSERVCEVTGRPGKTRVVGHLIIVLCDEEHEKVAGET